MSPSEQSIRHYNWGTRLVFHSDMFWSRCNLYRIGIAYLCMKTVERAHKPATLWHRIALDRNYSKALKQVDSLLAHWYTLLRDNVFIFLLMVLLYRSRFLLHKSKQRLTKITQYLLRARILMREKRYWLDKCLSGSFFWFDFLYNYVGQGWWPFRHVSSRGSRGASLKCAAPFLYTWPHYS